MARRQSVRKCGKLLQRTVEITAMRTHVWMRVAEPRGAEPEIVAESRLELCGTADEPVREVTDVEFHMYPADVIDPGPARPAAVGAIIQIRPWICVVIGFPRAEFDRLWSLALSGQLKYAEFFFTRPRYKSAKVIDVSFSNLPVE